LRPQNQSDPCRIAWPLRKYSFLIESGVQTPILCYCDVGRGPPRLRGTGKSFDYVRSHLTRGLEPMNMQRLDASHIRRNFMATK
jgi:hypothetical protein